MYSIQTTSFGSAKAFRLVNKATSEYVEIVPSLGAIVNAFVVNTGSGPVSVVEGFKDDKDFQKNNSKTFRSNKLFPFPNRIRQGKYSHNGKTFRLPLNFPQEQNSIHGLVLDVPFIVTSVVEEEKCCILTLSYSCDGVKGYPFPFELKIDYRYSENSLLCITTVHNTGTESMPYGDGWHHYFSIGEQVNDLTFSFPSQHLCLVDKDMIPSGKNEAYSSFKNPSKIENATFDSCFYMGNTGDIEIDLKNQHNGLDLKLQLNTSDYPYLQIYIPPHRRSIAIEPMTCAPDAFNNGMGLRSLLPGTFARLSFAISVKSPEY